ncbi:potassium channel family protein [Methylobacterium durans]|jgi:voltage-gated potassium channel|uniref:Ion transporter n=1 Tax=Methylobacterium durans TaxID=2202825 RepID=A0A2U8WBW6_9HYPH|nr:potassium channel family protein [Methylobacterium durans]AWN43664.1 ion transporter [Methylobacterium durans]
MTTLTARLKALYEGDTERAHRFRYGLLIFDLATLLFIVLSSFAPRRPFVEGIDVVIGVAVLTDFAARLAISRRRWREFLRPTTWADLAAIVSFLAPIVGEGAGFLRILRTLRFLRTYQVLDRLRADSPLFRRNEEVVIAVVNLAVFIFVMTSVVYATQHRSNPNIGNYVDALYFTVTSLTTTGYGDVTLQGTGGRLLSVVVMICGVTLFLRLAQVLFRPYKVRFPCPTCGLQRHEPDAVHCKACGTILNIPDEGAD